MLQELPDLLLRAGGRRLLVQQDRLGDLVADAVHRVERVHRALEHDRGAGPAHGPSLAPLHREDVLAVEQDLAGDLRAGRQQPQQRERERRLAAAGLAGDAELLARVDAEVHAAEAARAPPAYGHFEVSDVEKAQPGHPQFRIEDGFDGAAAQRERERDQRDGECRAARDTTSRPR